MKERFGRREFIGAGAFKYCRSLSNILIPNNVSSIGQDAFYGCSALEEIVFPESLSEIGSSAFEDCSSLITIILPEKVEVIEAKTFYDCSSLQEVTLSKNTREIKEDAFARSYNLTVLTIPENVEVISEDAFYKVSFCKNLLQNLLYRKGIVAVPLAVLFSQIAFLRSDLDVGSGIQFSADAPIETGSLEGVRSQALLLFGIGLCACVLFGNPLLFLVIPNGHDAVCIIP